VFFVFSGKGGRGTEEGRGLNFPLSIKSVEVAEKMARPPLQFISIFKGLEE
jgi:hypothetical protein